MILGHVFFMLWQIALVSAHRLYLYEFKIVASRTQRMRDWEVLDIVVYVDR